MARYTEKSVRYKLIEPCETSERVPAGRESIAKMREKTDHKAKNEWGGKNDPTRFQEMEPK